MFLKDEKSLGGVELLSVLPKYINLFHKNIDIALKT